MRMLEWSEQADLNGQIPPWPHLLPIPQLHLPIKLPTRLVKLHEKILKYDAKKPETMKNYERWPRNL